MSEEKLRYFLKRVTADLHETRRRFTELEAAASEPVAIVGMGCRFPGGVTGPESLWELLAEGRDAISGFPDDRGWDLAELADAEPGNAASSDTAQGGFTADAAGFDAEFFGISPREALAMDPQQRMLLEVSWEALEHAGIDPAALRGSRTGVFAGAAFSGYGAGIEGDAEAYLVTGNATSVLSGRVSYVLGLEGPAVTVDTACSSALVALHLSCQALRARECDLALAGGVTVMTNPGIFVSFSRLRGVAQDGRCKSYGAAADGSGWAEGSGVLVVERLCDARRNGHRVLAVVRGSAVNQDGASNGLTAPNGPSQQRVIRAALASARLSADQVDVVEGHGSGTVLGDPIEAQAVIAAYGQDRPGDRPLWLGSVKSNIGHTQAAAGAAGIIKMVQALQHETLPRTLHVDEPSPEVDWSAGAVRLLAEPVPWPAGGGRPRRAGVSSFGVSGTNVHVILEETPAAEPPGPDDPRDPEENAPAEPLFGRDVLAWVVSGRSAEALAAQAARLGGWVAARPDLDPVDVAWSLATARSAFACRAVVTGRDVAGLAGGLAAVAAGEPAPGVVTGTAAAGGAGKTVFVFAGQGAQWAGMGRELAAASPVFAARLAECARALAPYVGWDPADVLAGAELETAEVAQPALWAVMVSLAAVWQAAGVAPDVVIGHSQGEIAAATVAGMLSLEDAARVVAVRSRALSRLGVAGGMVSVLMPEERVRELMVPWGDRLALAAVNGPAAVVVSGEAEALAEFEGLLAAQRVLRWRVPASDFVAHSPAVDGLAPVLARDLAGIEPRPGRAAMFSTVTGSWVEGPELDAGYWFANVRQTVGFAPAVRALAAAGYRTFVEVSPQPVLTNAVTETLAETDAGAAGTVVTGTLRREDAGPPRFLAALAEVSVCGVAVDWPAVLGTRQRVALPTYAFQHQRYWPAPVAAVRRSEPDQADQPDPADWWYRVGWAPVPAGPPALTGRWLVVAPDDPAAAEQARWCARAIATAGAEPIVLRVPADQDRVALAAPLFAIQAEVTQAQAEVAGVVSLLALTADPVPGHPVVARGLADTLALVQGLGDTGIGAPLWALTRGAVAAGAGDVLTEPAQAQAWGVGRVAALELSDRWGGLADLPPVLDEQAGARLAQVLAGNGEDQVAIRPAGVLARRLARIAPPRVRAPWSTRGTVLVTGGTGAVAGHVAGWAATRGAPRLVLASRSGPAARGTAALAARLAAGGTGISVVACDTADRGQLAGLLSWIGASGPALSAVMHAAGVVRIAGVQDVTVAELAAGLAAKAGGAWLLHELTAGLDLDAFVLFSSLSSTWGAAGQAGYAAANTFLDALGAYRQGLGLAATAIALGPCDGGGMAGGENGEQLRRRGLALLDPVLAVQAMGQVLDSGENLVTVADVDWARFAPAFTLWRPSPLIASVPEAAQALDAAGETASEAASATPNALTSQLVGRARAEQDRILTDLVRAEAARLLGHPSADAVEAGRAFSELGFDSLTAVELRDQLNTVTGLRLPVTLLFDYPTSAEVARFLRSQLAGGSEDAVAVTAAAPAVAATGEPVAIVGMGCRFPGGVQDPEGLWQLLLAGRDAISGFPHDRGWDLDGLFDPDPDHAGTSYVREGGFVQGAADFDAGFFRISPREALAMDPQQRLLLETSWEAVERAGIDPVTLAGSRTGVFVGASPSGYGVGLQQELEGHLVTGTAASVMSGRVSYTLGLEGPAVTIDTACSSALVALHLASQALRAGECDLALVGGAWVAASPALFVGFSQQQGLAADGRSKAFSAAADGMGIAEGAGMLLVERLSDARRNGHPVLAVVAGSAVNQDGASNGLTAPNGPSQQRVIRAALDSAGIAPDQVDAVEAHGTGTKLGDPIEAQALLAIYGQGRPEDRPLWLGSVKSNLGHTQAAAGAAGIIKMILALRHGLLPRSLHAGEPSPHVDWSAGAVRLLAEPVPWQANGHPRRAGVSSFGISGTNAHIILEEPPAWDATTEAPAPGPALAADPAVLAWLVSGRSAEALAAQAGRLSEWLAARPDLDPADVAWSLARTRSAFSHRAVVTGQDRDELAAGLAAVAAGQSAGSVAAGSVVPGQPRVGFLFSGQGSQRAGMAAGLHAASPVFAAAFDQVCVRLEAELGEPLADMMLGRAYQEQADRTLFAQTGLFAVQVGLVAVLAAAGVTPEAVAGHSVGEVAAAYAAGVLSLEDACTLVAARARLMQALPGGGAMCAIAAPEADVAAALAGTGGVSLAAVNGAASVVISGDAAAVAEIAGGFAARGVRTRELRVSHAFHSARMDPVLDELGRVAAGLDYRAPRVPWAGALTGELVRDCGPGYWVRQAREAVRFADAVAVMAGQGIGSFLEIGPDGTLSALGAEAQPDAAFVPTQRPGTGAAQALTAALARVHVRGVPVDWTAVLPRGQQVELPTYAFQHERYWPAPVDIPALIEQLQRREQGRSATAGWRYREDWVPVSAKPAALIGRWLVVAPGGPDGRELAAACQRAMTAAGAEAIRVEVSAVADRAAMTGCVTQVLLADGDLAGVVSLLGMAGETVPGRPVVPAGLAGTLALVQGLGDAGITAPLWAVTRGAVAAEAGPVPVNPVSVDPVSVNPVQAQVWGLGRVVALEHPERWGGLIDLPPTWDEQTAAGLVQVLAGTGEDQVAIRAAGLLARRLTRAAQPRRARDPWSPRGTVVVTGGTGAIGGRLARWLAGRGASRLALASRSGPAAAGTADLAAELAAAGAAVEVTACDMAQRDQAAALLTRLAAQGPVVSAVVHTAGIGQATAVEDVDLAGLAEVLAPKAAAAAHLDELTVGLDLDAFVLFSSIAATWGSGLQPGYAAANAHLDALADSRRARGLAATSVAWGLWGGDGGMAGGETTVQLQRRGLRGMDPDLAVQALAEVLDSGEDRLTIADIDWARFLPAFTLRRPSPLLKDLPEAIEALAEAEADADPTAAKTDVTERLRGLARIEQERLLAGLVQTEAAAVLGHASVEAIEAGQAFRDLGFDSLTAIELRNRLTAAAGVRLPATLVFDYPTPAILADYLRREITQDEIDLSALALAEIRKLEELVQGISLDDNARADLAIRVKGIVSVLENGSDAAGSGAGDSDLEAATVENIFDLLDKELGDL